MRYDCCDGDYPHHRGGCPETMEGPPDPVPMTLHHPDCRNLRARQLRTMRSMRRAGLLALAGYTPEPGTDVQRTWRRHGWAPSGRVAVVTVEYRAA